MRLKLVRHLWGVDLGRGLRPYLAGWRDVGYEAIEVSLRVLPNDDARAELLDVVRGGDWGWVPQVFSNDFVAGGSVGEHLASLRAQVEECLDHRPLFINAHSGYDAWSASQAQDYFGAALELEKAVGVTIAHEDGYTTRYQNLAAMPTVRIDPVTGVISLPEDVLFPIGRAELGAQGRAALHAAVDGLVEVLPCYVANQKVASGCAGNRAGHEIDTIYIEGHTDSRPMARGAYDNTSLSLDRARAVHAALVEQSPLNGYRNRLAQPLFSFSAYGDKRLLPGIDPTDARNRRVDLRIVLTYRTPSELEATLTRARAADAAASR